MFHPQQLVIISRLAVRASSADAYTSTFGSKLVEIRENTKRGQKTTPTFAFHLRTATAPHEQPQSTKFRHASYAVCGDVGCAKQLVLGSQKRLTRGFRELEAASQRHKKLAKSLSIQLHASPMKKRLSPWVCWSSGGPFEILEGKLTYLL